MVNVVRKVVVLFRFVCGFGARDEHAGRLATYNKNDVSTTFTYHFIYLSPKQWFEETRSFHLRRVLNAIIGKGYIDISPISHTMENQ